MSDVDDSDTETVATGIGETVSESDPLFPSLVAVTVKVALPVLPSLDATMLVVPAATAVTTPVADTDPTAGDDDDQLQCALHGTS